mmetsp:Transcript_8674/g.20050  ORF Transcript_8674/g.20050 Transcript_8674/m.20050 type:complete len:207 (+) Transcript_8674:1457-2077(+)
MVALATILVCSSVCPSSMDFITVLMQCSLWSSPSIIFSQIASAFTRLASMGASANMGAGAGPGAAASSGGGARVGVGMMARGTMGMPPIPIFIPMGIIGMNGLPIGMATITVGPGGPGGPGGPSGPSGPWSPAGPASPGSPGGPGGPRGPLGSGLAAGAATGAATGAAMGAAMGAAAGLGAGATCIIPRLPRSWPAGSAAWFIARA